MGAYGGTVEASKSPVGRVIALLSPNGGEIWRGIRSIQWNLNGQANQETGTVSLFYSPDSGTNWMAIYNGSGILARGGEFEWNMDGLTSGTQYRIKILCDQNVLVTDMSDGDFTVLNGGIYYVNDSSMMGDDYCTTAGSSTYDGLKSTSPKDSIQAIFDAYDIEPGDIIYVDSGTYLLDASIGGGADDNGSPDQYIRIRGVKGKTILESADSNNYSIAPSDYTSLENLTLHHIGISYSDRSGRVLYCTITESGISRSDVWAHCLLTVDHCLFAQNSVGIGSGGNWAQQQVPIVVRNSVFYDNGIAIYQWSVGIGEIRNCIFRAKGPNAVCLSGNYTVVSYDSDYNDFSLKEGAKVAQLTSDWGSSLFFYESLSDWRAASGCDGHSLSIDPVFNDPENGDFHLKSTAGRWDPAANGGVGGWVVDAVNSPCIDAGDPTDSVGFEPMPNGGRINIGVYGGTAEASKSPTSGRWLMFDGAGNREPLHAWEPLKWLVCGAGWAPGETVRLEVSDDSGGTWLPIGGAGSLAYDAAQHWWDSRSVPDGNHYRFRVVANAGEPTSGTAERDYAIHNLQAPWGPNPSDGATGVPINTDLGWNSAAGAAFYDVYLWESFQTKPAAPLTSVTVTLCDPPQSLAFATVYKWQVVARNGGGQTAGPEWTFVTMTETGSLHVTISPQGAIDAGAQWRRTGTETWFNSGFTESGISVGSHTVEFKSLTGWNTPVSVPVTINNGETTALSDPAATYTRHTGTVTVSVTPSEAEWSFTDGDGTVHRGTGSSTLPSIPTGTITLTWLALSGFTAPTPNPESKSLAATDTIVFSGTYTPYVGPSGTVVVAVTPDTASWTFTDANSGIHIGTGDASLPGVPAGDVVMTWNALADHDEPVPSIVTQALTPNGSTTFTGAYARHKGTVQVSVTPDSASWSFTDGDGGAHNGTGDASVADIPTGTITLTWNALTGYRMPSVNPEAKAIGKGGTVTFVGTYSSAPARAGDWMLYE